MDFPYCKSRQRSAVKYNLGSLDHGGIYFENGKP